MLGCASISLRNEAGSVSMDQNGQPAASNFDFSWDLNNDLSSEYFGYFNFNIINKSDKWHTLTGIRIVFPESVQNKNVRVILGRELEEWYKAQQKVREIADFNKASATLFVAGVGACKIRSK